MAACSFVHFPVDKAPIQAVSLLLSVSFLAPTFQNCAFHQAVLVSVRLVLFSGIGTTAQKRVEGSQDRKEKARTWPLSPGHPSPSQDKECSCISASHAVPRHLSAQPTPG